MSESKIKPVTLALGTALVSTAALIGTAQADANPFVVNALDAGHYIGDEAEGSCGEGKCGESSEDGAEGSCGEGSCGEDGAEGSCGEGKCGS
ncbi:MAG: low-complexity protein [Pseudomonadota bacterium]